MEAYNPDSVRCTHRNRHGLLHLFVADQLDVAVFIIMDLEGRHV